MYWDDENLFVEPYERKQKKYYCGKRLLKIEKNKKIKFTLVIIDLEECYCANIYEDGDVEKLFNFDANVPRKHGAGGQSQRRFERARESAIVHYFKKINDSLKEITTDFIIGINFMYKNQLDDILSTENKKKLIKYSTIEYGGETGCYQFQKNLPQSI